jgi:cytochrome c biogenesis protein CcmG/thiol:disulfide interchange protein DsbE
VVDADGLIVYKHIGPVNEEVLAKTILPLVESLRQQTADQKMRGAGS